MTLTLTWPDPVSVPVDSRTFGRFEGARIYQTPDGEYPSVTSVNKCLGLSGEGLIRWAANLEQAACIEAAVDLWASNTVFATPTEFAAAIKAKLGKVKAHARANEKAKDIGSEVHDHIKWFHHQELGIKYPEPTLRTQEAMWAWLTYKKTWDELGGRVHRSEQPVWCPKLKAAGTIDLIVEFPDGLELWDFKTSKAIYDEHHVQAATYTQMARRWVPIVRTRIVHIPKTTEKTQVELVELGDLNPIYGQSQRRRKTEEELVSVFRSARTIWEVLAA